MNNEIKSKKEYFFGIDLIRAIAAFFVLSVHFFLYNGFYERPMVGFNMFVFMCFRNLFFICVPLFMIMTGYLKSNKKYSGKYYKSLIPILVSYTFAAIISIIFKITYLGQSHSILFWLFSFLDITADNYAWYVNMYIGFFLLIPFVNGGYNSLKSKKEKIILILTLFLMTSISDVNLKIYNGDEFHNFASNYWIRLYPFLYYFIGAYIKEHKVTINKILGICLIVVTIVFEALYSYYRAHGQTFRLGLFGDYNGVPTVICATAFFLLVYNVQTKNNLFIKIVKFIAPKALDIYLISYIFDTVVYGHLMNRFESYNTYCLFYLPIVLSIFLLCLCYGWIKQCIIYSFDKYIYRRSTTDVSTTNV